MGCAGDGSAITPNLDRLASAGTLFNNAYTNSPICVPARASFATGSHVYQHGCWDNAQPYHGQIASWGHNLMRNGHLVTSVGKLHYREAQDDNGFTEEIAPMHVLNGIGDIYGLLRKDTPKRLTASELARQAGAGESSYTRYDRQVADLASQWLEARADVPEEKPWVLYVGFVCPHFPLIAPPEFYHLYDGMTVPMPRRYDADQRPNHPVLRGLASCLNYDDYFDEENVKIARTAYYALVSFLDYNIGKILRTLEDSGLMDFTRVMYLSDHGDNLGNHGFWGKSTMYEESARIPLILSGEGVPTNRVCNTLVSIVDAYPTIVEAAGSTLDEHEQELPGRSLLGIAADEHIDRTVLSEYHAIGSITGMFMIRKGKWKLVHYEGESPQLFDLDADPEEACDLGNNPDFSETVTELTAALRAILDPEEVNRRAFEDQDSVIRAFGGDAAVRAFGEYGHTPAPLE